MQNRTYHNLQILHSLINNPPDLLQVLTLLTMERPISFSAEDIRDEKVRVLRGIPAIEPKNVIIGQYGKSLDGSKPGYKEDDTVPKESRCPTFASMVVYIKNERWDGVPFILKAGKGMLLLNVFTAASENANPGQLLTNRRPKCASSSKMSHPAFSKIFLVTSSLFASSRMRVYTSR